MEGGSFVSLHELLLGWPACGHIAFLLDTSQWVSFSSLTILLSYMGYPASLWFWGQSNEMRVSAPWSLYSEETEI